MAGLVIRILIGLAGAVLAYFGLIAGTLASALGDGNDTSWVTGLVIGVPGLLLIAIAVMLHRLRD